MQNEDAKGVKEAIVVLISSGNPRKYCSQHATRRTINVSTGNQFWEKYSDRDCSALPPAGSTCGYPWGINPARTTACIFVIPIILSVMLDAYLTLLASSLCVKNLNYFFHIPHKLHSLTNIIACKLRENLFFLWSTLATNFCLFKFWFVANAMEFCLILFFHSKAVCGPERLRKDWQKGVSQSIHFTRKETISPK